MVQPTSSIIDSAIPHHRPETKFIHLEAACSTEDALPMKHTPIDTTCACKGSNILPQPPSKWPQSPLLLRPTPNSHTQIHGIRHSSSKTYLHLPKYCTNCTLPINTGFEPPGKSLVIDFETNSFIGTVLFRIQECKPPTKGQSSSDRCYFDKRKRTFQAVVRGRFKLPNIPMSECITGQMFHQPPGYVPSDKIVNLAIKLFRYLAPQLDAKLDRKGTSRFFSPLLSTAQSVSQTQTSHPKKEDPEVSSDDDTIDNWYLEEPHITDPTSLLHDGSNMEQLPKSCSDPKKNRKKAFDFLYCNDAQTPTFDTSKEYTFEFYQHLLYLEDMALDLGRVLGGRYSLTKILNGQPIKFMVGRKKQGEEGDDCQLDYLWSFDIWHECLYEAAELREEET